MNIGFWIIFGILIIGLLWVDLRVCHRKEHIINMKESLVTSAIYIVIALLFNGFIYGWYGHESGTEFLTSYLIEKSLSIDNLFVFALIFHHFNIPSQYQHRVLFWGILGTLIMRGILIWLGVNLISQFSWLMLVMAVVLIFTGIKMLLTVHEKPDLNQNRFINLMKKYLPVYEKVKNEKFFITIKGKKAVTPLFLALCLIEASDLIFAFDSLPAVLGVTPDPFIIYTSNIFALLGMRSLYFALANILKRFYYLKYALSIILIFIGFKMFTNEFFSEKIISTQFALTVTCLSLLGAILLSWIKQSPSSDEVFLGWVPGNKKKNRRIKK